MAYENVSLLVEYVSHDQGSGGIPDSGFPKNNTKKGVMSSSAYNPSTDSLLVVKGNGNPTSAPFNFCPALGRGIAQAKLKTSVSLLLSSASLFTFLRSKDL
jgi:hypothetical protein